MKKFLSLLMVCAAPWAMFAQCPSGTMGVSGAGCGCLAGCNLTSIGGPNCGAGGVSGNCSAGYVQMTNVDIVVPANCTYTVTAEMKPRTGCSASGADGSCQTCDVVKVDIVGGVKSYQQGGSNASLIDSYTLVGPGTIRISGRANRADEIITWSVTSGPATCPDCSSILSVELVEFNASMNFENRSVNLAWGTQSETDNAYFEIERSINGVDFEPIYQIEGQGTSSESHRYNIVDSDPYIGKINYYRLKQVDFNGAFTYSEIKSVYFDLENMINVFPNPANDKILIQAENVKDAKITILNNLGQPVHLDQDEETNFISFATSELPAGVYFIRVEFNNATITKRLIIQH